MYVYLDFFLHWVIIYNIAEDSMYVLLVLTLLGTTCCVLMGPFVPGSWYVLSSRP
jgi:hypothetical protein